jgi:hypothetical protein
MRISQRWQRPNLDMRNRGGLDHVENVTAEGEQAGDRDRVKILDGIDDMLVVLGLEALHLQQAHPRQFRGHPAARLHRHVAHRHPRQHV